MELACWEAYPPPCVCPPPSAACRKSCSSLLHEAASSRAVGGDAPCSGAPEAYMPCSCSMLRSCSRCAASTAACCIAAACAAACACCWAAGANTACASCCSDMPTGRSRDNWCTVFSTDSASAAAACSAFRAASLAAARSAAVLRVRSANCRRCTSMADFRCERGLGGGLFQSGLFSLPERTELRLPERCLGAPDQREPPFTLFVVADDALAAVPLLGDLCGS